MKKTQFFITMSNKGKKEAWRVAGYGDFIGGLPIGLHKSGSEWVVSELSTGCAITRGRTRADALDRARPSFDKVREMIIRDDFKPLREMIAAAYAR